MRTPATEIQRKISLQAAAGTQDLEALADAALVKAGLLKPSAAHPHVERILDAAGGVLSTWAMTYAPPGLADENLSKAQAMAFTSQDFKFDLAGFLQTATVTAFRQSQKHRALARLVPVRNFQDHEIGHIDADTDLLPMNEAGEYEAATSLRLVTHATARIRSFGRLYAITRAAILNDEVEAIAKLFGRVGGHASRLEARMLHELLASNPTLSDGESMFSVDAGNVTPSGPFSAAGLQQAMHLMRNQLTDAGEKCDLEPAAVVVPADQEVTARQTIREIGLPIEVHPSCWIEGDPWYLLARPDHAPVLGLMHLRDADAPSIVPLPSSVKVDGVSMSAQYDVGVVALGRLGAVKVDAV